MLDNQGPKHKVCHMTPTAVELLSLSELSRWAHKPTETVRREIQAGTITPDFISGRTLLFKKSRVAQLVAAIRKIS